MPCLCTANTLRLFVQTVAHVDLPQTARFSTSRQFHIAGNRYSSRESKYTSEFRHFKQKTVDPRYLFDKDWEPLEDDSKELSHVEADGAVVDFSPEAIDAIAAEAGTEALQDAYFNPANTTEHGDSLRRKKDLAPQKKHEWLDKIRRIRSENTAMEQTGIVRRAKSENTGLKIHYSADPDWANVDSRREWLRAKREREKEEEATRKAERQAAKDDWVPPPREPWMLEKARIKEKYPDGYQPLKRLSPDAIAGIRALHAQAPEQCTTEVLAAEFKVTPEAIRRILKSKWTPTPEEQTDREQRWMKRGEKIWSRLADMGTKPPKQWREKGIGAGKPDWMKPRPRERMERPAGPRPPLPALITTARRREVRTTTSGGESLSERII